MFSINMCRSFFCHSLLECFLKLNFGNIKEKSNEMQPAFELYKIKAAKMVRLWIKLFDL